MLYEKYINEKDEDLIIKLRDGETEIVDYLLEKYKNLVKKRARTFFLIGGDTDDLIQEGMIGLYKAIRDYKSEEDSHFSYFADLCISRQIYTAINSSQRKKHSPLNSYISFSSLEGCTNNEIMNNPEMAFIYKEDIETFKNEIEKCLSKYERQVMELYIEGNNYQEIAKQINKTPKSVDNAIQRIKSKIDEIKK